jgi:sugar/nucleoside kinase (ribokinase family)
MTGPVVTCAGIAVCDVLARTVSYPLPVGFLQLVDEVSMAEGGCALRTARAVASMGIQTRLVAAAGEDAFGRYLRESVRGENLTVDWVASDLATSSSLILVDSAGGRTILHKVGSNARLTADAVRVRMAGRILHVGGALVLPGLDGLPLAELFREARRIGMTTSLDVVFDGTGEWKLVISALAFTDLFYPSREEAAAITGRDDAADSAAALRGLGVRLAMVTDGRNGCWVDSDDYRGHVPAFQVATVDTTGAGDGFAAGAIVGVVAGLSPFDTARLASAMGALATTTIGTFAGPADTGEPWRMAGLDEPAW